MITIDSHAKKYDLEIYHDFSFFAELKNLKDSFWVIDKNVLEIYGNRLFNDVASDKVFVLEAIEENKTIETALEIAEKITELPAKRNVTLISVGGGIVQDITGFVCSTVYRGIYWRFVPTTLLAACDSCIGGKTSLNYKKYKNLLGTFFAPDHIYIAPEFFLSLSEKDYESGMGEVVKFNILAGGDDISDIESKLEDLHNRDFKTVEEFLVKSLNYKKNYIEEDEFDRGIRIYLNFAHTFGHAFETTSRYNIPHGTAVAMGMIAANRVSLMRGWLKENTVNRIEKILLQIIHIDTNYIKVNMQDIINAVKKDKKQINTNITTVLIKQIEEKFAINVVHDTSEEEISRAVSYLFNMLETRG